MRAIPIEPTTTVICPTCGADSFGCAVKLGLGGRRCCDECDHDAADSDDS